MDELFLPEKMASSLKPPANSPFQSVPRMLPTDIQTVSFSECLASSSQVSVNQNLSSQEVSESVNGYFSVRDMKLTSLNLPENKALCSSGTPETPSTSECNSNSFLSLQNFVQLMKLPEKQTLDLPEISNDGCNGLSPNKPDSTLESSESLTLDSPEYSKFESEGFVLQRNHFDDILDFYSKFYKIYKCDDCGKSLKSHEELDKHWKNSKCSLTNKHLKPRGYWEQYFKSSRRSSKQCFDRPLSMQESNRPLVITKHNAPRKQQKPNCHICGKILNNKHSLNQHLRIHTGERPYACHLCDKTFPYSGTLNAHIRSHDKIKTHFCEVCNKGFASKANVKIHMRQHTGDKNFMCDVCSRAFYEINQLNQHKRIHSDERPYLCHLCPCSFKIKDSLNEHLLTHSDERPFKCDQCDSTFKTKSKLRRHQFIHSEVKPHQCATCGKGFSQRVLLVRHFKIHPEVKL